MDDFDDLFSVPPSNQHEANVHQAVAPILASYRTNKRRAFLHRIFGGAGFVAASVLGLLVLRRAKWNQTENTMVAEPGLQEVADLLFSATEPEESTQIVAASMDIDFGLLSELELIEVIEDQDFS